MKTITSFMIQAVFVCLGIFGIAASASAAGECPNRPVLLIDNHTLALSEEEPVCVKRNGVFRIKLVAGEGYTLDTSKVTVSQKEGGIKIEKENVIGNDVMKVRVGAFPIDSVPEYTITVEGVGILDPRVRINSNYPDFSLTNELIDEYLLDEYGLSLLDLQGLDQHLQETYNASISDLLLSIRMTESE
ncbi:MAG: hypothetical protein OEY72_12195 [Gammaproteobacteria bacterium]|nr:hypothetical protein [Gammaproteobacteria bacterium]